MDLNIIKAFAVFYSENKRRNNLFNRKSSQIIAVRDSYYAYALDQWTHVDELNKYKLVLEIYGWIEESGHQDYFLIRRLFPLILSELSRCSLDESASNQELTLVMIRCGLDSRTIFAHSARLVILDNLKSCKDLIGFQLERMISDSFHAKIFKSVFEKLILRLNTEDDFLEKICDGSHLDDIAEELETLDIPVDVYLKDKIKFLENIKLNQVSESYIARMEHIRTGLSKLFARCSSILSVEEGVEGCKDSFALKFLMFVTYNEYLSGIKQIAPSWVRVEHIKITKECTALADFLRQAPSSPFFWFYVLALEVSRVSRTVAESDKSRVILNSIKAGISGRIEKNSVCIKYVTTNLPVGNDATRLLAENIQSLLDQDLTLESSLEYSYYLACLNEPYGVTQKKKSWYKKHAYSLLTNSRGFVEIIYRIYLSLEFKKRKAADADKILDDASWTGRNYNEQAYNISLEESSEDVHSSGESLDHSEDFKPWPFKDRNLLIQNFLEIEEEFIYVSKDMPSETLETYLKEADISSMTSPEYILGALEYYMEIHDQGLPHRNPVWINGTLWSKIRRGKVRLLVRIHENDIVIHAYKRKEYHPQMFDR